MGNTSTESILPILCNMVSPSFVSWLCGAINVGFVCHGTQALNGSFLEYHNEAKFCGNTDRVKLESECLVLWL